MNDRREYTLTKLERDAELGYWRAHVSADGRTALVDRRYGSWRELVPDDGARDLLPEIAAALQERVRPRERSERAAVQEAAELEQRRRLAVFKRELEPSARDLEQYREDVEAELAGALRGLTLERILTDPALAWARPTEGVIA